MRRAEATLLDACFMAGIKVTTDMVIGKGTRMDRTHLTIFRGMVDYQGVFSEER